MVFHQSPFIQERTEVQKGYTVQGTNNTYILILLGLGDGLQIQLSVLFVPSKQ